MTRCTVTDIEINLNQLIDETANSHEPIFLTGAKNNAILISEDAWSAIQETLYLLSIPGMRDSIKEGLATSIEDCDEELNW